MIKFKNNDIRVRCIECKESQNITLLLISEEKEKRSIGTEYEYIYRGESNCTHCNEKLRILSTIFEYPIGQFNYVDNVEQGCLIMDKIEESSFITK
jgi:hypothetical protein